MFRERNPIRVLSAIVLVAGAFVVGCSSEVPKLTEPPKTEKKVEKVRDTTEAKDTFTKFKVDILFVVDDSGSMDSKQRNLAANVSLFTQSIQANKTLDWQIGVITSSTTGPVFPPQKPCCGELVGSTKFVTPKTVDWITILQQNLIVGTDGDGAEEFFRPVVSALSSPMVNGVNQGFYRPDAFLSVVFITDTDDQGEDFNTPQQFWQTLKNLKGDAKKVLAYAAIIPSIDRKCDRSGESLPERLEEFLGIVNRENGSGLSFGLCDTDFGLKLAGLGADISKKVGEYLLLSRRPVPGSIKVVYGTQAIPNDPKVGFVYDNRVNGLRFGPDLVFTEQPDGTKVEVAFEVAQ